MKTNLFMVILFVIMIAGLNAEATIRFEQTTIDFGTVQDGESVDVEFRFKNTGDSTLLIKGIRAACGCTVTRLEKKRYTPGESGVIPVKFMSRGYGGRRVTKMIKISTNDQQAPYVDLKITGDVSLKFFAKITLDRDRIDFGKVKTGSKPEKNVIISNPGTIDLKIVEVSHSPDVVPVFSLSKIAPSKQAKMTVRLIPRERGTFETFIKIHTNAYKQYLTVVKIIAEVE